MATVANPGLTTFPHSSQRLKTSPINSPAAERELRPDVLLFPGVQLDSTDATTADFSLMFGGVRGTVNRDLLKLSAV